MSAASFTAAEGIKFNRIFYVAIIYTLLFGGFIPSSNLMVLVTIFSCYGRLGPLFKDFFHKVPIQCF